MRALLSTIGSRGEAQPVLALAARLRESGHEAVVCAPPDFRELGESLGIRYVGVGPELRGTAKAPATMPTPEQRQQMIDGTVAEQFRALNSVAEGCDVVVGGGALAIAAHSVAEAVGAHYVYTAFAPITLPSPHHAPPVFGMLGGPKGTETPRELWSADRDRWNTMWRTPLNTQRAALGLEPVDDVRSHLFTSHPWLAADPVLAPWPGAPDLEVTQTGAWLHADHRPLSAELETFLDAGDPPIYLGFGSARAPRRIATDTIAAARAHGRRVIVSTGWSEVTPAEAPDCLLIGEVNQQSLFPRVAAIVHHGGAGTTTAATAAGTPQLVIPQMFDQPYFADRVETLGIGTSLREEPTEETLHQALSRALDEKTIQEARTISTSVERDGTSHAARTLSALVS